MHSRLLLIVLGAVFLFFLRLSPLCAQTNEPVLNWRVYPQLTAEHLDGDGGIDFGLERLRIRTQMSHDRLSGVAQVDLGANDPGDRKPGTLSNVIMDVYLQYALDSKNRVRFGQFKTPLGLDFNMPANSLDITKRGMDAGLILQRDLGVMVSGRGIGRFGYDAGIFNIAGRSSATSYLGGQEGDGNAYVARGHYDSDGWHAELALGTTPAAGGPGTADYRVGDFALQHTADRWTVKAEWIAGENVRGDTNRDEDVYYVHGSYALSDRLELLARRYAGESRISGSSTELTNTYLGFTWWPQRSERLQTRLQVNYVVAGKDEIAYTGLRGFRDDALFVQLQLDLSN